MTFLLDPPEHITIEIDADGRPLRFIWRKRTHKVLFIANHWQAAAEWWLKPQERDLFKLATDTGFLLTIYHDLGEKGWYVQCIYD